MARTEILDSRSQRSIPLLLLVAAALLMSGRVIYELGGHEPADLIEWVPLKGAAKAAAGGRKPIMYDFTAEWCEPCRMLQRDVFSEPDAAAEIDDAVIPVRITDRKREEGRNSAEVEALQKQFAVGAFPTIIFADSEGRVLERMVGYTGRREFMEKLRKIRFKSRWTPPKR